MRTIPEPTYNYEAEVLVKYYQRAARELEAVLQSVDLTSAKRTFHTSRMVEIQRILADLNVETAEWAAKYVPAAVVDGAARTLVALEVVSNMDEARRVVSMSRINEQLVETAIADLQDDLLAVTQNVERKVRTALRQSTQEAMRINLTAGRNNNVDITRDILAESRSRLGAALDTGIIDAAGRRWKPEVYANMVARTKLTNAHLESTQNEAVSRGAYYGIISSHGAKDYCRFHEGRIVKLTPDAPGDYPTVSELKATGQIFHPRCKHIVTPVRNLDRLPEATREKAGMQAERGDQASQLGRTVRAFKEID